MFLSLSCLDNLFLSFLNLYIYGFCQIWEVFTYCFFGFFFFFISTFFLFTLWNSDDMNS